MDGVDKKMHKMTVAALIFGVLAMHEEPTTVPTCTPGATITPVAPPGDLPCVPGYEVEAS
jgi:hypothetical protein